MRYQTDKQLIITFKKYETLIKKKKNCKVRIFIYPFIQKMNMKSMLYRIFLSSYVKFISF